MQNKEGEKIKALLQKIERYYKCATLLMSVFIIFMKICSTPSKDMKMCLHLNASSLPLTDDSCDSNGCTFIKIYSHCDFNGNSIETSLLRFPLSKLFRCHNFLKNGISWKMFLHNLIRTPCTRFSPLISFLFFYRLCFVVAVAKYLSVVICTGLWAYDETKTIWFAEAQRTFCYKIIYTRHASQFNIPSDVISGGESESLFLHKLSTVINVFR